MPLFKRIVPVADTVMIVGTGDPTEMIHHLWAAPQTVEASNDNNRKTWTEVDVRAASLYQFWRYPAPSRRVL